MVACPNLAACQGERAALLACQDPNNATRQVDSEQQVCNCLHGIYNPADLYQLRWESSSTQHLSLTESVLSTGLLRSYCTD